MMSHQVGTAMFRVSTSCAFWVYYDTQALTVTVITLNIGTPRPATVVVPNIKQFNFTLEVMPPKDVEKMANSVDPDQTAP